MLFFYLFLALFGDYIAPFSPTRTGVGAAFIPPGTDKRFLFGTDNLGRDIYSGYVGGARVSVLVGFIAAGAASFIGIVVGGIAGYSGGRIDDVLSRITEIVLVMPTLVLALTMAALFGSTIWNVILILSVLSWPGNTRLVRAEILSLRESEFVTAAKALGEKKLVIIFRELLPHALVPTIVSTSLAIGNAILLEAGLSFLGLGDPNAMSWGFMLQNAQSQMQHAWWPAFFPGLGIFTLVLGANLVGDGLDDALNPRLKERT